MALRTEDKAVEEGLGPLPGQDRTGGAGTKREQDRAISDVVEVGASNLAWSQAADMRERLACHLLARRPGCPVARAYVRVIPAQGSGRGPREGVPPRA